MYRGVIEAVNGNNYQILWDEGNTHHSVPDTIERWQLVLESDLPKLNKTLEKEFRRVKRLIRAKMKQSAKSVKEAQKLASSVGFDLENLRDATRPLVNEMDNAGWQSSSWNC